VEAINRPSSVVFFDLTLAQETLGLLAMQYRGTREPVERSRICFEYATVVNQLIASKMWNEAPPLEDQLPVEDMPDAFWEYWSKKSSGY